MVTINFEPKFPTDLRSRVDALVRKYELLFPLWMQEVRVCWGPAGVDDEDDVSVAAMGLSVEYRNMTVRIYPVWLSESPEAQEEFFLHEVSHCLTAPAVDFAKELLNRWIPDGEDADGFEGLLYKSYADRIEEISERITQDFCHSLLRYTEHLTQQED